MYLYLYFVFVIVFNVIHGVRLTAAESHSIVTSRILPVTLIADQRRNALQCLVIRQLESRSSNSRLVAVIKAQSLGTAGDRKTQNTGCSYDFHRVESETTHF